MSRTHDPAPLSLSTSDGTLRVDFRWQIDRYVQHFSINDGDATGNSVEGDPHDDWPASPPLQQLSLEHIDGKNVILGVGAAGQSHWSISVETFANDQGNGLKFELACRCKANPLWLGSTYQMDKSLIVEPISPSITDCKDQSVSIRPDSLTGDATRRWSYCLMRTDCRVSSDA